MEVDTNAWSGWQPWSLDPYEHLAGPFYFRIDELGRIVCAFRAEAKHLNSHGTVHGGCLMTFADGALFQISRGHLCGSRAVTVSLAGDFVDGARQEELVEASGSIVRRGGSLIFIQGLVSASERPILRFSGILKVFQHDAIPAGSG